MTRGNVTLTLKAWSRGDMEALQRLIPLVAADLQAAARYYLSHERSDHTLQPTALVSEVCIRLMKQKKVSFENRAQFFGFAGKTMRRLLIDHARARGRAKRGGNAERVDLTTSIDQAATEGQDPALLLDLDASLDRLAVVDARAAQVVEMKYFLGLDNGETAKALGISIATVKRDWLLARRFLALALEGAAPSRLE